MGKLKFMPHGVGILLALIGIGAVSSGIRLIFEPDGSSIGMSLELLKNSPFESFIIPGIVLLFVIGIGNLFGAYLALTEHQSAGLTIMALGLFLILWILAQAWWIGMVSFLQPIFLMVGAVEMLLGYALHDLTDPEDKGIWRFPQKLHDFWMWK